MDKDPHNLSKRDMHRLSKEYRFKALNIRNRGIETSAAVFVTGVGLEIISRALTQQSLGGTFAHATGIITAATMAVSYLGYARYRDKAQDLKDRACKHQERGLPKRNSLS